MAVGRANIEQQICVICEWETTDYCCIDYSHLSSRYMVAGYNKLLNDVDIM